MKKITVLIPCYNEEEGIANVLHDIQREKLHQLGYIVDIAVIDNNSSDNTSKVAKENGARVIFEPKKGKGNAIKTGFESISSDTDYIIMLDGDDTYKASEIQRLIEPLESNFCDVVVGSRLGGKMMNGSLRIRNRMANWAYTFLVRHFYHANITDVLSGFFAWKKTSLDGLTLHLESDGFAIEMEMVTKMVKLDYEIYSVPITYKVRKGKTKIDSLKDGLRILKMFFANLNWTPNKKYKSPIRIHK